MRLKNGMKWCSKSRDSQKVVRGTLIFRGRTTRVPHSVQKLNKTSVENFTCAHALCVPFHASVSISNRTLIERAAAHVKNTHGYTEPMIKQRGSGASHVAAASSLQSSKDRDFIVILVKKNKRTAVSK